MSTRCARIGRLVIAAAVLCPFQPLRAADQTEDRMRQLELMVHELSRQVKEKDQRLTELETKVRQFQAPQQLAEQKAAASRDALEAMLKDIDSKKPAEAAKPSISIGGANLRLMDISLDVLFAFGSSSATDAQLKTLQGGAHDPNRRGFSFNQAELSMMGAIDPYLYGEMHLIFATDPDANETIAELEEAFLTTQTLPLGLQIKAGYYFTEFGRINATHPHAWAWIDQPVINSRLFGGDGQRQTGARLGWLAPLPWFSELYVGVQNANGETMPSFQGTDQTLIAGRPRDRGDVRTAGDFVYSMRWVNSFELTDELTLTAGGSGLYGANATGGQGATWIYGGDLLLKWKPAHNNRGWPFVAWQSEIMRRDYQADGATSFGPDGAEGGGDDAILPREQMHDWGFYTQVLYGFSPGWAAGARYEYAGGGGASFDPETFAFIDRNDDGSRDDRHRVSPLIIWQPSEFSRLRLQYNYDNTGFLEGREAHSVWLSVEFLLGAHPAHNY